MLGLAILSTTALSTTAAQAQEKFQIHFRATLTTTNDSGRIIKKRWTERTLIKQCIADQGITNHPPLVLAYNVGGDFNGDVIEVINKKTGEVLCQKLRLLFPQTLINGGENQVHQSLFVFTDQQSDSVGSGIVSRKLLRHNRTLIDGSVNFFLLPDGTNGLQLVKAHFTGSKPLPNPAQVP